MEGNNMKSKKIELIKVENLTHDVQIIDTREENYYIGWKNGQGHSGHIEGAIDFPASWLKYETDKSHLDIDLLRRHIDKNKKTVLYADDTLEEEVAQKYLELGFSKLSILEGGINKYCETNSKLEFMPGYSMYVSPQWVQDVMEGKVVEHPPKKKFKIAEVDVALRQNYDSGHIESAIYINTDKLNHYVGPRELDPYENISIEEKRKFWNFLPDYKIREVLEDYGIDADTTVILYASYDVTTGANRAALVMDYIGVKDIRFINGGKELWKLEGRVLVKDVPEIEKAVFGHDVPKNLGVKFDYEDEIKFVDDKNAVIASVRSWAEYLSGESQYAFIAESGDIKKSRFAYSGSNPYAMEDYRNIDNTMFNYKIIANRWVRWGISSDKTISFHCGTGWRASEAYYAAKALGWTNIGVYDGGWYEWMQYPNSPVKEIGLPKDAPEEKPEQFFY